jgi:hypothetical protein
LKALIFLAVFAHYLPTQYEKHPGRVVTTAVAGERAVASVASKWHRSDTLLGAAIATAVINESGLAENIHTGDRRGGAGEICLVQIHPSNKLWRKVDAPSFEALAGAGEQATTWCLATAGVTLAFGDAYCQRRRYYTNWMQAMWTMYHFGSKCWLSPHARPRSRMMSNIASRKWEPSEEMIELMRHYRSDD